MYAIRSYYAYEPAGVRVEPWEPNVTALLNPEALKWKDLVEPGTPLPTPWPKEEFEAHAREIQERRAQIRAENRPEEDRITSYNVCYTKLLRCSSTSAP